MISISETEITSSRYFRQNANVRSPAVFTAHPSATVSIFSKVTTCPALIAAFIHAAPSGSTPITLTCGLTNFVARATPDANPPPPIGTKIASTSFNSFIISRAVVPCPNKTSRSLNGCTYTYPCSRCKSRENACASSNESPCKTTSAPSARVASTLRIGVVAGMQMTALTPNFLAANPTPCA